MKKSLFIFISIFIWIATPLKADDAYFFYVQLKDKNNSPYSLEQPLEFLSQRALDRRAFYNIDLDESDLPVNPAYIQAVESLGIDVHSTTKWLNGLTVLLPDSNLMQDVRYLPFVDFVQFTGISHHSQTQQSKAKQVLNVNFDYGVATNQINQLKGKILHENNYTGNDIYIAVLDAGFLNADSNPAFDDLRNEERIIGVRNVVNPNRNTYLGHQHGAQVLSIMAGVSDAPYVGTAPHASYVLIQTENDYGEYLCEPDFWISGMEYADSLGVDITTTSLGYTEFDISSMNYVYSDLDGHTARASIAANMAFEKGILVFNSAGNEGNDSWKYISVPADAPGVITVGAVDVNGRKANFSSFGPTADGRIKPELVARGTNSALISPYGNVDYSSGTSFSCPILAGMSACFLQATRDKAPHIGLEEVRQLLYHSGNQYDNPDNELGYGIPNFQTAYENLLYTLNSDILFEAQQDNYITKVLIDGTNSYLHLKLPVQMDNAIPHQIKLINTNGTVLLQEEFYGQYFNIDTQGFPVGVYIIQIYKN